MGHTDKGGHVDTSETCRQWLQLDATSLFSQPVFTSPYYHYPDHTHAHTQTNQRVIVIH